jgi:hypothetical protein
MTQGLGGVPENNKLQIDSRHDSGGRGPLTVPEEACPAGSLRFSPQAPQAWLLGWLCLETSL